MELNQLQRELAPAWRRLLVARDRKQIQQMVLAMAASPARVSFQSRGTTQECSLRTCVLRAKELAHAFVHSGLHTCAVIGNSSIGWLILDLAALLSGVTVLAIPENENQAGAVDKVLALGGQVLFVDRDLVQWNSTPNIKVPIVAFNATAIFDETPDLRGLLETKRQLPDDCYTVAFTSGTLGRSKPVRIPTPLELIRK